MPDRAAVRAEQPERVVFLALAAMVGCAALLASTTVRAPEPSVLALLAGLAFVAELLPARFPRTQLQITLSLPFITTIVVIAGYAEALLVAVPVAAIGAAWSQFSPNQRWDWRPIVTHAALTALGVSTASAVSALVESASIQHVFADAHHLAFAAVFVFVQSTTALAIYQGDEDGRVTTYARTRKTLAIALVVYLLLTGGVVNLARSEMWMLVPLMLLPVLALRTAVMLRAQMYSHYYETITALTVMLQRAHPYTHTHLDRVAIAAEEVGLRMGLPPARARLLREAAVLHDIGKIANDESILDKPGKLTPEEYEHVKRHVEFGTDMLEQSRDFRRIVHWIRYHHERIDGRGYPGGLDAKSIPVESRILAVVDAYDAMVGGENEAERRSYRVPKTPAEALEELRACSGTQFDGAVVETFAQLLEERTTT